MHDYAVGIKCAADTYGWMSSTLKGFVQICAHIVVDGNGSHEVK